MERNRIELKVTSEIWHSGMRRVRVPREHVWNLKRIVKDEFGQELSEVARNYRESKYGWISFNCGVGYAVIDADLLGGNGDGTRESILNRKYQTYFTMK